MSGFALIYKERTPAMIEGSQLRPDTLCALSAQVLAATPLRIGRAQVPLGDVFSIVPAADDALTICNAPPLDRLGANMSGGELIIEGDAGDDVGASMSGGRIRVHGHAGHRAGGPEFTSRRGMTGGEIIIRGNAGDHAGFLMRRGIIAIAGRAGNSPGFRMLAGTLIIGHGPLNHPGLEMQRGTIICLGDDASAATASTSPAAPPCPPLRVDGRDPIISAAAMPSMLLVTRRLDHLRWLGTDDSITPRIAAGAWRITDMDPFALNKGEVLQWQA
jgi:formylmethanofuran dehydrogenase subunit C